MWAMVRVILLHEVYNTDDKFMCVDLFAGKAAISKAFRRRGMRSVALDVARSPGDDTQLIKHEVQVAWSGLQVLQLRT